MTDTHAEIKRLFDTYSRSLYNFCFKIMEDRFLAEDAVSHAYVQLFRKFDDLPVDEMRYRAFLYLVARNKCLSELKHMKRVSSSHKEIKNIYPDADMHPLEKIIYADILKIVLEEADKLPDNLRKIFKLLFVDNLSHKEISDELGISSQAVRNYKNDALSLLKLHLHHKLT